MAHLVHRPMSERNEDRTGCVSGICSPGRPARHDGDAAGACRAGKTLRRCHVTAIDRARTRPRCEWCDRKQPQGCDPAHIFSRGAGRVDHDWNLAGLCRECHGASHSGLPPSREQLIKLAAEREGVTPEQIIALVYAARRFGLDTVVGDPAWRKDLGLPCPEIADGTGVGFAGLETVAPGWDICRPGRKLRRRGH